MKNFGDKASDPLAPGARLPGHGIAGGQSLHHLRSGEKQGKVGGADDENVAKRHTLDLCLHPGEPERPAFGELLRSEQVAGATLEKAHGIQQGQELRDQGLCRATLQGRWDGLCNLAWSGGKAMAGAAQNCDTFVDRPRCPAALRVQMGDHRVEFRMICGL